MRVLGIEEEEGENCATKMFEFFRTKLHSDIKSENITVAHRVKGGSPRGIIVRFSSREVKSAIIQNRRILKGSGVVIVEDLCQGLQKLMSRLHNDDRISSTWAWNGRIWAKLKNSEKGFPVEYGQSIEEASKKYS